MRALLFLLLALPAAHAATILNVTLSPSPQSGVPGQTLTFSGVLENTTGSEVFLNSNSYTFDIGGLGVVDDALFLSNAPISLAAMEVTSPFDFFTVTIPGGQAPGPYLGVFTVLGGADGIASDVLGNGTFTVEVAAEGVPEPGSIVLLCGGLGVLGWMRRRKFNR